MIVSPESRFDERGRASRSCNAAANLQRPCRAERADAGAIGARFGRHFEIGSRSILENLQRVGARCRLTTVLWTVVNTVEKTCGEIALDGAVESQQSFHGERPRAGARSFDWASGSIRKRTAR